MVENELPEVTASLKWSEQMSKKELKQYNRIKKQESRQREKDEKDKVHKANIAALEAESHSKRFETEEQKTLREHRRELRQRVLKGLCLLGEVSPGVDADNISDALQIAREFARAMGSPDIVTGESLLQFEERTWIEWTHYEGFKEVGSKYDSTPGACPYLNRSTQQLSPGWGNDYWLEGGFKNSWTPLPGSDVPIVEIPELV
jgi:hypothetical protein